MKAAIPNIRIIIYPMMRIHRSCVEQHIIPYLIKPRQSNTFEEKWNCEMLTSICHSQPPDIRYPKAVGLKNALRLGPSVKGMNYKE